jgi:NADH:ubiquinone reductase (H+-translocating)
LSAPAIASPIRHILRDRADVTVLMTEVTGIDLTRREVRCVDQVHEYDFLIISAGAETSYFGNAHWEAFAPGLKTLDDAFEIRRRMIEAFELAELGAEPSRRESLLTFAVIGGGPTGVELAGTLVEIARHTLKSEFRRIDPASARIVLIEGAARILGAFSEPSAASATAQLERLGVRVMHSKKVTVIDAHGLELQASDGSSERLACQTILWAAGVRASPLTALLGEPLDRSARVAVTGHLSLASHPEVFAIGDMAQVPSHRKPIPGVAPAAKQMGRHAAGNVLASLAGKARSDFRYVDYGSLATIGRHAAVVEIGRFKFSGFLAWMFWLFIHIFFLIGFRNRFLVMLDWATSYLTFERYARIITPARRR